MVLNKVNYTIDPAKINKDQAGTALGSTWKEFQVKDNPNFDPSKPYFVVFKDGYAGIDFDIVTREKILKEESLIEEKKKEGKTKKNKFDWVPKAIYAKIKDGIDVGDPWELVKGFLVKHGLPITPDKCYIVKSGSGGFHYYLHVQRPANLICQMGSNIVNFKHISVDYRCGLFNFLPTMNPDGTKANLKEGGGGIFYGVGTKWKDHPGAYTVFIGNENTIPEVDGWRIVWLLGRLPHMISHFKIADFLNNKIDVHVDSKAHEHELVIWKETMFLLKELGYTEIETDATFSRLNCYDSNKARPQIKAWWDKENDPKRAKAFIPGKNIESKPASVPDQHVVITETGTEPDGTATPPVAGSPAAGSGPPKPPIPPGLPIPYQIDKNAPILIIEIEPGIDYYLLEPTGIWHVRVFKKGNTKERKIWDWKSLKITMVMIDKNSDAILKRYNFEIDGGIFRDCELKELIDKVYEGRSNATGEEKNILGRFVTKYIDVFNVPVIEYAPLLGFTVNGWRMFDKYWIAFKSPIHMSWRPLAEATNNLVVEEKKAKELARLLYENTTIAYEDEYFRVNVKDILLAFNMAAPFMYALLPHTELMPMIAMSSFEGERGKTSFFRFLTTVFYGFPEVVSPNMFKSGSRAEDYISFSTFPVFIDDITKLPNDHKAMLKSALTTQSLVQKKDSSNKFFVINKPLSSPVYIAYNEMPELFDDDKILSRTLIIPANKVYTDEDKAKFDELKEKSIPGYLGRYYYEKVKDFTYENVLSRFKLASSMPLLINGKKEARTLRQNSIYKLGMFGARLYKEIFDVELNPLGLELLIKRTIKEGSENVFGIIYGFLEGCMKEKKDRPRWINSELYEHNGEYRFDVNNLADVNNRLKSEFSLEALASILGKKWNSVKFHRSLRIGDYVRSGIVIPKNEVASTLPQELKDLEPGMSIKDDDDLKTDVINVLSLDSYKKDELKAVIQVKYPSLNDDKFEDILKELKSDRMIKIETKENMDIITML